MTEAICPHCEQYNKKGDRYTYCRKNLTAVYSKDLGMYVCSFYKRKDKERKD